MLGIGLPGQVENLITWTVEGGKAVKIEGERGGREAAQRDRGRGELDGHRRVRVRRERHRAVRDAVREGPRRHGHFALGDNHNAYPGGQNVCKLHLDGVILDATLEIVDNGQYIVKDGEWAL